MGVGGSLVYNGVTYQSTRQLFDRVLGGALDYDDEMADVYYPRVRGILQPSAIPADILASDFYLGTRVFLEEAAEGRAAGASPASARLIFPSGRRGTIIFRATALSAVKDSQTHEDQTPLSSSLLLRRHHLLRASA